jgi:hypothetical protein
MFISDFTQFGVKKGVDGGNKWQILTGARPGYSQLM